MSVFFGMYKSIPNNYAKKKVQRVYPNTHSTGIGKSKGLQSAGANATLCYTSFGTWAFEALLPGFDFMQYTGLIVIDSIINVQPWQRNLELLLLIPKT